MVFYIELKKNRRQQKTIDFLIILNKKNHIDTSTKHDLVFKIEIYIYSKWFSYYLIKVKTDINFAIEQFSKRKIKKIK